jgi:hypothetical protein
MNPIPFNTSFIRILMDPPAMAVLLKVMRAMLNREMRIKLVLKGIGFILNFI